MKSPQGFRLASIDAKMFEATNRLASLLLLHSALLSSAGIALQKRLPKSSLVRAGISTLLAEPLLRPTCVTRVSDVSLSHLCTPPPASLKQFLEKDPREEGCENTGSRGVCALQPSPGSVAAMKVKRSHEEPDCTNTLAN